MNKNTTNKYTSFILAFPRSALVSLPVDVARTRAYGVAIFLWFLGTIYLLSIRDRFKIKEIQGTFIPPDFLENYL